MIRAPSTVRATVVVDSGTTIAYTVTGRGPPLLLAHGAEADQRMFGALVPHLAGAATVITFDQRDCGGSTTGVEHYDLTDLAADVVALVDHLGYGRVDLLGQSLGGAIAQLVAARHGERIARLVLASTFRAGLSLGAIDADAFARLLAVRDGGTERERAELFLTPEHVAAEPSALGAWRAIAPITTPTQRQRRARAIQAPLEPVALESIVVPTLVVHGTADQIVPIEHARANGAALPAGQMVELVGVGHVSPLQAPAALGGVVAGFLASTGSPP